MCICSFLNGFGEELSLYIIFFPIIFNFAFSLLRLNAFCTRTLHRGKHCLCFKLLSGCYQDFIAILSTVKSFYYERETLYHSSRFRVETNHQLEFFSLYMLHV